MTGGDELERMAVTRGDRIALHGGPHGSVVDHAVVQVDGGTHRRE
jgi:hypothetical protein